MAAPAAQIELPSLPSTVVASRLKRALIMGLFSLVEARLLWRFLRTPARMQLAAQRIRELKKCITATWPCEK
ncbi:hypothetical protein ACFQT0_22700 [Hymenobacter humi]|uniref:Uncharacterized protein n=1 Tax=Hymenobacter humi TaxID=1411620 RepID=A0ABW2UC21_9BACT